MYISVTKLMFCGEDFIAILNDIDWRNFSGTSYTLVNSILYALILWQKRYFILYKFGLDVVKTFCTNIIIGYYGN
jgi:hypothetical protein